MTQAADESRRDQLKTHAELTQHLLRHGLTTVDQVTSWADGVVAELAEPPSEWIDLCMAQHQPAAVVESLLRKVAGVADADFVWQRVMGAFLDALRANPERDSELAKALYIIANNEELAGLQDVGAMMSFWDAIDLAHDGIYGDPDAQRQELESWLLRMSATAEARP